MAHSDPLQHAECVSCGHSGKSRFPKHYQCSRCYYRARETYNREQADKLEARAAKLRTEADKFRQQAERFERDKWHPKGPLKPVGKRKPALWEDV